MRAIAQTVSWWCFVPNLMTPAQFVRAAAAAGFTAIDLVPPDYWDLVAAHGLTIASIQGHRPLEMILLGNPRCAPRCESRPLRLAGGLP